MERDWSDIFQELEAEIFQILVVPQEFLKRDKTDDIKDVFLKSLLHGTKAN